MQLGIGDAIAWAQRLAPGLHHRPVAGAIDVEPYAEHGARESIGPGIAGHGFEVIVLPCDVPAGSLRSLLNSSR
jgi:hypothetical protein